jgi:hypothetical protein
MNVAATDYVIRGQETEILDNPLSADKSRNDRLSQQACGHDGAWPSTFVLISVYSWFSRTFLLVPLPRRGYNLPADEIRRRLGTRRMKLGMAETRTLRPNSR